MKMNQNKLTGYVLVGEKKGKILYWQKHTRGPNKKTNRKAVKGWSEIFNINCIYSNRTKLLKISNKESKGIKNLEMKEVKIELV